ncbi:MAG: ATP-binding cassette domain-containing protein [Bryobacteraceae bacterium]|jgi:phospholipid/cholesterol/gamma-HCH transport system ATP-binding protein
MGAANGQQQSVLRFENVSLAFDETIALDRVSFEQKAGETRVVLGQAGSGKTALLKTAIGLLKPDSGRVWLLGEEITSLSEHDLFSLRSRVGVLFQEGGLFDSLTVGENVAYPLENQQTGVSVAPEEVERRVEDALRFVELEQTLDKFPGELSGGMRRRVGIARASVTEPPLVLYDSPTAGLDPITANTIVALIAKERDMRDTANLMVTYRYQDGEIMANFRYNPESGHLVHVAAGSNGLSTTFMVMEEGRLVFEGSQKELEESNDPYVTRFVRH